MDMRHFVRSLQDPCCFFYQLSLFLPLRAERELCVTWQETFFLCETEMTTTNLIKGSIVLPHSHSHAHIRLARLLHPMYVATALDLMLVSLHNLWLLGTLIRWK